MIRKKGSWKPDPTLVELYEDRAKRIVSGRTIPRILSISTCASIGAIGYQPSFSIPKPMQRGLLAESSGQRRAPGLRARVQQGLLALARALFPAQTE